VTDVSEEHLQDSDYFGPLEREMDNGGPEALFHMLLNRNIHNFNPRNIPRTKALDDMKKLTIAGTPYEFWHSILQRGSLDLGDREWNSRVAKVRLHEQYSDWAKGIPRKSTETQLGMALKKICPHLKDCWIHEAADRGSKRGWDFGDLKTCRAAFCRFFGWPSHEWDDEQGPESDASARGLDNRQDKSGSDLPSTEATIEEYDNFDQFHEKEAMRT
jgi:hypothetical protein